MLSSRFAPWHVPLFAAKYAWLTLRHRPILVHFEVTMRCNAHCDFCDYWKTDPSARERETRSFAQAARFFSPIMITFTGGEPLLRRDLEDLVAGVARAVRLRYIAVITHGGMLTVERARSLWDAGLNQFNISLDFLDERHDAARGVPGLSKKILDVVPRLRSAGIDSIRFNTVIKRDNLSDIVPIVRHAEALGVGVSFSTYTDLKNGNGAHRIGDEQMSELDAVIAELLSIKRRRRGIIVNSDHYLRAIPRYARGEMHDPCLSGQRTIHVDPMGFVRRCPDFPSDFHWTEFRTYQPIDCNACFYACRGESQAPLSISRVRDIMA
ncbi:MAG TPA: radical SAM protein [Gemmatimonadaceae bacterium]|nr:radical SAM protein [Gemmatimonadaceae bacterium]